MIFYSWLLGVHIHHLVNPVNSSIRFIFAGTWHGSLKSINWIYTSIFASDCRTWSCRNSSIDYLVFISALMRHTIQGCHYMTLFYSMLHLRGHQVISITYCNMSGPWWWCILGTILKLFLSLFLRGFLSTRKI